MKLRMKRSILTTLMMLSPAIPAADWNRTPEALVRSFQADYLKWNSTAVDLGTKLGSSKSTQRIENEYGILLRNYTLPDFKGEPIAYGTPPSHNPSRERTLSVSILGDHAIVRTDLPDPIYTPIYEYELIQAHGRWYLTQIYLVDEDGRIPGL